MGIFGTLLDSAKTIYSSVTQNPAFQVFTGDYLTPAFNALKGPALDFASSYMSDRFIGDPNANEAHNQSKEASALAYKRSKEAATTSFERTRDLATTNYEREMEAYKKRYQYVVDDLKRAGLNPILAAGQGISTGNLPDIQSVNAPIASAYAAQGYQAPTPAYSGAQAVKAIADTKKSEAETLLTKADTILRLDQANHELHKINLTRKQTELTVAQEDQAYTSAAKSMAEIKTYISLTLERYQAIERSKTDQAKMLNEINLIQTNIKHINKQREVLEKSLAELTRTSNVYSGPAGAIIKYTDEIMDALNAHLSLGVHLPLGLPKSTGPLDYFEHTQTGPGGSVKTRNYRR